MKDNILNYIKDNKKVIIVLIILTCIGIVAGIISFNFISEESKVSLNESIKTTFEISKQEGYKGVNILKSGIQNNLFLYGIFAISSLTIIAPLIVCVICLIKGYTIGLFIVSIVNIFGGNSVLPIILIGILPNLIYISICIYFCLQIINMYYTSDNLKHRSLSDYIKLFIKFSFTIPFIIFGILLEQVMFKIVLGIYINM